MSTDKKGSELFTIAVCIYCLFSGAIMGIYFLCEIFKVVRDTGILCPGGAV